VSEKGSDELLREIAPDYDPADAVLADWAFSEQEERNVQATAPADDEPGRDYPIADEEPEGEHEEFDTNPPEEP
jgi:hypothetical protein